MVIKMRLEAGGYRVVTAADGQSGLRLAEEDAPDLILLDIVMPDMDGIEVCKSLKANEKTKRTPVFAFTVSGETHGRGLCQGRL